MCGTSPLVCKSRGLGLDSLGLGGTGDSFISATSTYPFLDFYALTYLCGDILRVESQKNFTIYRKACMGWKTKLQALGRIVRKTYEKHKQKIHKLTCDYIG